MATKVAGKANMTINTKDAEFMFVVIQNVKGKLDVDWDEVAKSLNYKTGIVASTRFRQMKKKVADARNNKNNTEAGDEAVTPTKGPKAKSGKIEKTGVKPRTPGKVATQSSKKQGRAMKAAEKGFGKEDSSVEENNGSDDVGVDNTDYFDDNGQDDAAPGGESGAEDELDEEASKLADFIEADYYEDEEEDVGE